ncbi:hypothetical protein ACM64Y_14460 [Novispirillum sp. DQ9]|uniref:hypothetical protein n=1 Tax=Novispirillum sp. DQ9 TaxID=3398612 RepID=UPI003C7E483E
MSTTNFDFEAFLTNNEPVRAPSKMDEAQKMELRRANTLACLDEVETAVLEDQPVMRVRETGNGPVSYATDIYFRQGSTINFRLKRGLKSLSINGKPTFTVSSRDQALALIDQLRQAVQEGALDDSLRALYEIPADTLRKMQDMRTVTRLAKAKVAGKALSSSDRVKLERLLRVPAYRDAYAALTA